MGTCFHIGEGVFITARHVVENNTVTKIANTLTGIRTEQGGLAMNYLVGHAEEISQPLYHPNEKIDACAIITKGLTCETIPLAPIVEDAFGNNFILESVLIMGFPRICLSLEPALVAVKGEVNAAINNYLGKHRMYVISCLARGGFSGGPVLAFPDRCLALITSSLVEDGKETELGFMATVECLHIYELLARHKIMPARLTREWEEHLAREKRRDEEQKVDDKWLAMLAASSPIKPI